jgi:glycerol-3-phosphate dehydrogenase (NAD(P)+)
VRFAILGNGGFGTAIAIVLSRGGHDVALWGHDPDYTAEFARSRRNPRYLPGVELPAQVLVTADAKRVLPGADAVVVAVPTQHLRSVVGSLRGLLPSGAPLVSLAKGLEQGTALRPSEVLAEASPPSTCVLVLSGPSHAEEVAVGRPTAVVLAGPDTDADVIARLQDALCTPSFRVYRSLDPLGVELCGALKNVMAIAAGIADGLGYGDNAKAAILSRGIVEMARFGVACGADLHTFFGLAGTGDLAVTAFSRHGRNRAFGERIATGETVAGILASTRKVAEGVPTAKVVRERARALRIEMPICDAVCAVLFEGLPPLQAVQSLMGRDRKDEILR